MSPWGGLHNVADAQQFGAFHPVWCCRTGRGSCRYRHVAGARLSKYIALEDIGLDILWKSAQRNDSANARRQRREQAITSRSQQMMDSELVDRRSTRRGAPIGVSGEISGGVSHELALEGIGGVGVF